MRTVKPGVSDHGVTQVDGIDPGDVLAESSFDRLHDGALVTVAPPPGPAGSASASSAPAASGSASP
jgi:membrane fusion protein, multidrug efflux system